MNCTWLSFPLALFALVTIGGLILVYLLLAYPAIGQDNGISVGAPKVFDNRSLEVMLQQFELSLQAAKLYDQGPISSALGQIQGSQQSDLYRDLELTLSPTPKAPAAPPAAGGSQASTDTKKGGTESTAKPPAADTTTGAMPDISKKYGYSSEDLLNEQVNLTYQIFNLRMLLERSLSDRDYERNPRLQAVLGFEVSLNPPKQFKGAAAVVEVRLLPRGGEEPISLVAMMPREKTYNVATLTTKVNQFGGAAVVKIATVGYTERRRGQTFFLVKDTDTYAFQRTEQAPADGAPKPLVLGWVFRPVLNRPSVDAGTRQVFAVVALPTQDSISQDNTPKAVNVEVTTYWLPYNRKTATVGTEPKGGSKRQQLSDPISLFPAVRIQADLRAKIDSITWSEVGDEGVVVDILGDNFYNGTIAIIGGSVLNQPVNGLTLRNDHHIQVLTTLRELAKGGIINGRYGEPVPLQLKEVAGWSSASEWGLKNRSVHFSWTPNPARTSVALRISFDPPPNLHQQQPIIVIGKQVIPPSRIRPYVQDVDQQGQKIASLNFDLDVPAESLATEATAEVAVPTLGPDYHVFAPIYEPSRFEKVVRLRDGKEVVFGILGARLDKAWQISIVADRTYQLKKDPKKVDITGREYWVSDDGAVQQVSNSLIELRIDSEHLKPVKQFVVLLDDKTFVVPVPAGKAEPVKPTIDAAPQSVAANSSMGVKFAGTQLSGIKKVSFEGEELKSEVGEDGKSITIFVTRKVTSTPGLVELVGTSEDGKAVATAKLQIIGPAKSDTEKK